MLESSRTFRIYLISSFGDMDDERAALERYVFPRIKELCSRHGRRFQAIDLRRGLTEESLFDGHTMQRCLTEIMQNKSALSPPRFAVLLGDRYGLRGLPREIPLHEYEQIEARTGDREACELLSQSYRLDYNGVPPLFVLQPPAEPARQRYLRQVLLRAVNDLELSAVDRAKYYTSYPEQEIVGGPLASRTASENTLAFLRDIENADDCVDALDRRDGAERYFDTDDKGRFDAAGHQEITALKETVLNGVRYGRRYGVIWEGGALSAGHVGSLPEELDECLATGGNEAGNLCVDIWKELSALFLADLERMEQEPGLDAEVSRHHGLGAEHARGFVGRKDYLDKIIKYAESPRERPLVHCRGEG